MEKAIDVRALRKNLEEVEVLKGISFFVEKGEIFALLGTNGAEKTTALECIAGLSSCDGGEVTLSGKAGLLEHHSALPSNILPMEAVTLYANWNGRVPNLDLLDLLGILDFQDVPYIHLSAEQRRRLDLALTLVPHPEILILDEPMEGLEFNASCRLLQCIRKLNEGGLTILLGTEDLILVEELCDRVAGLVEGQIVFTGTVEELKQKLGRQYRIRIVTTSGEEVYETDNIADTLITLLTRYQKEGMDVLNLQLERGTLRQHFQKWKESSQPKKGLQ